MAVNRLSHRDQHRRVAQAYRQGMEVAPTAADYRDMRHAVAALRREEQRRARIAAGTDRATLRAARARMEG